MAAEDGEEWILVDGTPATCVQLGLFHFFKDRGPVDMVVSGPNYGRNTTNLFSLSSGTLGGAMEAATFRKKAIALSYAFYSRDHDPGIIAAASRRSVKLIEYFHENWGTDAEVYSINVPLIKDLDKNKVMFTYCLENFWRSGSAFDEVSLEESEEPAEEREREIRHQQYASESETSEAKVEDSRRSRHKHRHFKWAPKFADIHASVDESEPGNDGRAIRDGITR